MRSFIRTAFLALALTPFTPEFALSQAADGLNEGPRPRVVTHRRRSWRNSPIVWSLAGAGLLVALPLGVYRTVRQMRQWRQEQGRDKAPWERAQVEFERDRAK